MNWDENVDLLSSKKTVSQGRRSNLSTPQDESSNSTELINPFDLDNDKTIDKHMMKPRKTSVWGDEGNKSTKNGKGGINVIELERFQESNKHDQTDDIPIIPDIDDLQDDSSNIVEIKPVVTIEKSTYKELDNQLGSFQSNKINFGTLGNVDLSFLTNKLYPEKDVEMTQDIWTMDSLFNDLSRNEC